MAAPTFSVVANVVDEDGVAPGGGTSYAWQINRQGWFDPGMFPAGGQVSASQSSSGTASCAPLVIGTTERDNLYTWTTTWAGQFGPPGVYTDVVFATLVISKNGTRLVANANVTNIAGTITVQGGATFPFTAAMVGAFMQILVFWADANGRPVPAGTAGATARAEIGAHHTQKLKEHVQSLVGATPVPKSQYFTLASAYDPGFDFNLDTFSEGFAAMSHMGLNTPLLVNKPESAYVSETSRHRARQLTAGLNDWHAVNLARPPGNGWEWKTTLQGDVQGVPTDAGFATWAQTLKDRHDAAGYPASGLRFVVAFDEPNWMLPFELDVANNGTASVEAPHPSAGYTETGDVALAKARLQSYLQTLVDANGNALTPAYFGWTAWSDATFAGFENIAGTQVQRRRYAATMRFLSYHFAKLIGSKAPPALLAKFGVTVPVGYDLNLYAGRTATFGEHPAGGQWSQQHPTNTHGLGSPDFLYQVRHGSDFLLVDGWHSDYYAWCWSYRASIWRMYAQPAGLLVPSYSTRPGGLTQQTLSLVAHGAKTIQVYQMSPEYVRASETMGETAFLDSRGNVLGLANGFRLLAQSDDLAGPGTPLPGNKVAIHWPRSSAYFDAFGGTAIQDALNANVFSSSVDYQANQIGLYMLLMHMNVPVDWLDDEAIISGSLDNYSVFYVSGPNVHGFAQTKISNWTSAGGVLVTSVGAGAADWENTANATVAGLGGITESTHARVAIQNIYTMAPDGAGGYDVSKMTDVTSVTDASKKMTVLGYTTAASDMRTTLTGVAAGNVVARFTDNSPAVVDVPVGSGRRIHFAWPVGVSYIFSGSSPDNLSLPTYSGQNPLTAREWVVTRPLSYTTYKRPAEANVNLVETGVLTSSGGWAIVALNWTATAQSVNFRIRPPFAPTSLKRPDGTTIALTTTADGYTFSDTLPADGIIYRAYAPGGADTTPPTVAIAKATGQADPASGSPVNFTVTFSEVVTGFTSSDVSLAGSTAAGTLSAVVTGSGTTYNVAVSGMTGSGTVQATVPAGGATDAAGNPNTAAPSAATVSWTVGGGGSTAVVAVGTSTIADSGSAGGTTLTYSHTTPAGGLNRRLVVVVVARRTDGGSPVVPTVTYGGVAMTMPTGGTYTTGAIRVTVLSLAAPATGANNVVVTVASNSLLASAAHSFENAHQVNIGTPATASALPGGSISTTPGTSANDYVVDAVWADAGVAVTAGAGQVDVVTRSVGSGSPIISGASSRKPGTAGTTTLSWSLAASQWVAQVSLPIQPAVVGDTTAPSVTSRVVNAGTLTVTYDEALDASHVPAASAFIVKVNGVARAVTGVSVSNTGSGGVGVVVLTLASPVTAGQTVTLTYAP